MEYQFLKFKIHAHYFHQRKILKYLKLVKKQSNKIAKYVLQFWLINFGLYYEVQFNHSRSFITAFCSGKITNQTIEF
ncbi:MAG: hypothetical protein WAU21_02485, partial [Chitinophagales bacterium]